jgi:hypothetical protein
MSKPEKPQASTLLFFNGPLHLLQAQYRSKAPFIAQVLPGQQKLICHYLAEIVQYLAFIELQVQEWNPCLRKKGFEPGQFLYTCDVIHMGYL